MSLLAVIIALGVPAQALVVGNTSPYATRGVFYTGQALAGGGTPPYSFVITQGALPPGLQMDGTGDISGTPTHAGNYTFTVTATDSSSLSGTGNITIQVAGTLLTISPPSAPQGHLGVPYAPVTFSVSGGVPPYTLSLTGGAPPTGMTFNSATGVLSGTPTSGGGFFLGIQATDAAGDSAVFSIYGVVPDIIPTTQPDGWVGLPYQASFFGGSFNTPPALSVTSGTVPPGLSFSGLPLGGVSLSGFPTQTGTFLFTMHATDGQLTADRVYTINILPAPLILGSIPSGTLGQPYSQAIPVSGATPPVTFTQTNGTVPPGLLLSTSGVLSGTPTASGSYAFGVMAQDSTGKTGTLTISLNINRPPLNISPVTIPDGAVNQNYSVTFSASGGVAPYRYNQSAQAVPGMAFDSITGIFAGTPTSAGTYTIVIGVSDSASATGSSVYTFNITGGSPPFTVIPPSIPGGTVGTSYRQVINASGSLIPVHFTLSSGSLPPGLVFDTTIANGVAIAGTPMTSGSYAFQLTATDTLNRSIAQNYSINIATPTITLSPSALLPGTVGSTYNSAITAFGGNPPYAFSVAAGSVLPSGFSLSAAGIFSGMPVTAGNYPFTVQVQDSIGTIGTQAYLLSVAGPSQGPCTYTVSPGGKVFASIGGTGTIDITTDASCSWTISNVPGWVTFTSAISGTGGGTATYQLGQNSGADLSAVVMVAGLAFTVEQQASSIAGMNFAGSMPHVAAEENWTTAVTLVNKSAAAASARLSVFGDAIDPTGNGPLMLPLTFPQQPPASGPLLAASLDQTISANASLIVDTSGPQIPPVLIGSAQLAAAGSVDGFAIFHHVVTTQEAVVPLEVRNASSYVLAFDNTNGIVLGVAVANISAQTANIPVVIRDDTGTIISTPGISISIPANGHMSFVLSDPVNGFPVTANIRGTVEFDTPMGRQISVLGIRFTPPNNALTTIPALANVGTNGGSIAHLASGGDGWQTTFVLVNVGSSAAQATLSFFADITGSPLSLPLSFPQSGSGTATVASSITQTLAAGATFLAVSSGAVDLLTGSAQLSTTGNVSGFVIFRHNDQEAVIPLESRNASGYILAFDNTNGTFTGVAINSVSTKTVNIPVTVRDDTGAQIATDTLNLAPNGHSAFTLVTDKYPATAGIRGTIEFDTPAGAQIGALALRIPAGAAHTYTSLPALAK